MKLMRDATLILLKWPDVTNTFSAHQGLFSLPNKMQRCWWEHELLSQPRGTSQDLQVIRSFGTR
jgi:hypothetical protein